MEDIYETGYGNRFPDSNILSVVVPYIKHSRGLENKNQDNIWILDLGCGLGPNLYILNEFAGVRYQGIDISEVAIEIAKKRIQEMKLIERAQVDTITTEKFLVDSKHSWDLILDRASLQHHDVIQSKSRRNEIFSLLNSRLASDGLFVSLWAGDRNVNTRIRFGNFLSFEEVRSSLERNMNVDSIRRISQSNLFTNKTQLSAEEFLVVARKKFKSND